MRSRFRPCDGGPANPARESAHRANARAANLNGGAALAGPERWAVVDALWGLIDVVAIENLLEDLDPDNSYERAERPGTVPGEQPTERAATAISHHVELMKLAYPHAVTRSAFGAVDAFMHMMLGSKLGMNRFAVIAIAVDVGHSKVAAEAAHDLFPGANKRRVDEDDNPAPEEEAQDEAEEEGRRGIRLGQRRARTPTTSAFRHAVH